MLTPIALINLSLLVAAIGVVAYTGLGFWRIRTTADWWFVIVMLTAIASISLATVVVSRGWWDWAL